MSPITDGFGHIATLSTDRLRTAAFYQHAFGASILADIPAFGDHPPMTVVDVGGGAALNVYEVLAESIVGERRRMGGRGPIDHFGFGVASRAVLEQLRARLVEAGADEVGEVRALGPVWSLFFRDPDGLELEVCAPIVPVSPSSPASS